MSELEPVTTVEAFQGCLIGQAVGDALGFVIEGYQEAVCMDYITRIILKKIVPINNRVPIYAFGQYSDDTQLARELLISFVQLGGRLDMAHYACRIGMLFQPGAFRIVGYGHQTVAGATRIRAGIPHTESGKSERYLASNGNGSAMRAAPLGLIIREKAKVIEIARESSIITHASERTQNGAVIIALATHYVNMTRGTTFNISSFLEYVCDGIHAEFIDDIKSLQSLIERKVDPLAAKRTIIKIGMDRGDLGWGEDSVSCGVTQSVLWTLYSVCYSPDSYVDAIACAILGAGDVDTTAAMTGAIVGTRLGLRGIPTVWSAHLQDQGEWKTSELEQLARNAYNLVESSL